MFICYSFVFLLISIVKYQEVVVLLLRLLLALVYATYLVCLHCGRLDIRFEEVGLWKSILECCSVFDGIVVGLGEHICEEFRLAVRLVRLG